ncbi:MAG: FAD:protein FMN transferase [Acidobacteria bacterium]|nr:FAD:protein FMN transferase [Acidobacteriota bacterium]
MIRFVMALALLAAAEAVAVPQKMAAPFVFKHAAMGTEFEIVLIDQNRALASAMAELAFDEVDRLEELLSNYRETSELSRVNRLAGQGPVTVDPEMFAFLSAAEHWSRASDGAFDMSVGPLMRVWGFFQHAGRVPSDAEIAKAKRVVGWKLVKLDVATRTVRFLRDGVELDPGGIGKGFAVDAAVRLLREHGVERALISAGSSTIYGMGSPPGERGWKVIVRSPVLPKRVISTVYLRDESLSSANCTEKNFTAAGVMYCHIFDPRTGQPVRGRVHVSVIHPSATASDALSNVLFVQSPDEAMSTLRRFVPDARALVLYERNGLKCATFRWSGTIKGCR